MPASIELRSNPSLPTHYDKFEMGRLPTKQDREIQVERSSSSSTWPSTAKSSILPTYNRIFALFATLLLSTTLALFSALDAAINCTRGTNVWSLSWFGSVSDEVYYEGNRQLENEENNYYADDGYEYQANGEDDNSNSGFNEAQNCKQLFTSSVLPVCPIVCVLSLISCRWAVTSQEWKTESSSEKNTKRTKSFTGQPSHDFRRYEEFKAHVNNQVQHLKSCTALFLISLLCTGLWTYAMMLIAHDSDFPVYEDGDNNLFTFQFHSLGAIDYIGNVGQNANLYYSGWISLLVSFALMYELGRITQKQYLVTQELETELSRIYRYSLTETNAVETIMTWSKSQQQLIKDNRSAWHESLYKLRFRTGIWLTTLISSIILYQSSHRVWENSIYPTAEANGEVQDDGTVCTILHGYFSLDSLNDLGLMHPSKCERTRAARATGILCAGLSILALTAHYYLHTQVAEEIKSSSKVLQHGQGYPHILEKRKKIIPLRFECLIACVLSVFFAINALFATAVEGPAAKVGNLYYSSWIAFISSMWLALNCLEDILEQDEEELDQIDGDDLWGDSYQSKKAVEKKRRSQISRLFSIKTNFQIKDKVSTRLVMLAPTFSGDNSEDDMPLGSYIGGMPIPEQNFLYQMFEERIVESEQTSRSKRAIRWACGCIFSTIYLMAALDAAFHESFGQLDAVQLYMVIVPCIVASFSLMMFFLCLNTKTYPFVDTFKIGGVTSIILTFLWGWNLVFTLHNDSSWAVNEIGDVEMANLYYFTWLTVLNSGVLMTSYVRKLIDAKEEPIMVALWLVVVKICFVMFGSCCDILLSVRDQCEASTYGDATATFCERTVAGAVVGFVGMVAGCLAAIFRYVYPSPSLRGMRMEAAMSLSLTILFSISLALITGIGGPGQSVGDLYYGSWLAFLASLGVSSSLYSEIKMQERDSDYDASPEEFSNKGKSTTPYVRSDGSVANRI